MKTKFIYLLLIVFTSCATPQKVKDASHIQNESLKLFVQENTIFYEKIEKALVTCIDAQISQLEIDRDNSISKRIDATNEANEDIKNKTNLSTEDKIIQINSNERKLNELISKDKEDFGKAIQIQNERKNKLQNSILILKNMQSSLANSNDKLNEYIQLEKASDILLEQVRSTFPQLDFKMTQFESIINDF